MHIKKHFNWVSILLKRLCSVKETETGISQESFTSSSGKQMLSAATKVTLLKLNFL